MCIYKRNYLLKLYNGVYFKSFISIVHGQKTMTDDVSKDINHGIINI